MNNMSKKLVSVIALGAALVISLPALASAHVVVKPAEVGVGKFQTFTTGVPNEKDMPTIAVRLVIPDSLGHVSPNVKPGWTIDVTKTGEGEKAKVTEINWTGGSIASGFRDEFLFSAQAPAKESTLQWKAYQTYEDGTVVAWDQASDPKNKDIKPYSETKVINDLSKTDTPANTSAVADSKNDMSRANLALGAGLLGMVLGGLALTMRRK